ncbi:hypothetical protein CNO14_07060 (plasmid) [Borrelia miyamotoi]|uniref:Uncharacterized protein n=1 Tax=Borrelia miyamotoi TaxID=47466 RepID=A0AAQ3CNP7_9SPIR|nr:hypothetical protein [Borrelia miyamotoi]ATQ17880.1 hypothetical protein CNO12_06215 [Borrelia miyamotoi]ATQ20399.1 hypothetical protein CNO10_06375 [Borrelia miyamotoi]ATQ21579.1 hypothetical protein CNO09_05840 [Borrelia miyamotoi]QBK62741.1 hypothetical protein EZU67_06300 [Borrelia miyamotoi]QBK63991.1 hypothetical protein EZU68_06355 [Borrelia miyamotoi]
MKKIGEIKLYKPGEVSQILEQKFNYKIHPQNVCRKATILNAYVTYNDMNYVSENIISHFTTDLKKKETKSDIKLIVQKKLEKIKKNIKIYEKRHKIPPTTAIKRIKTQNINTTTIIKAIIQLTEEIDNIKKQTQEDMKKTREQIQEEIQDKNEEIIKLKKQINKIEKQAQEEIQDKNEEIIKLKKQIQKILQQTQENVTLKEIS